MSGELNVHKMANLHYQSEEAINEVKRLLLEYYGINAQITPLYGEADINYKATDVAGNKFTVKLSSPSVSPSALDFQMKILEHVSSSNLPFDTPQPRLSIINNYSHQIDSGPWKDFHLRLQSWVTGRVLDDVNPRNVQILNDWGTTAGYLSSALEGFDHEEAHRFYAWNPSETLFSRKYLSFIKNENHQNIAEYFWNYFESTVLPKLPDLCQGINYNDAHELNLLVATDLHNPTISGVIDFGDAIYTHTINELAIACAYAAMKMSDPLSACCAVLRGYNKVFPLEESELAVLYGLIAGRLLISVSHAAKNREERPENAYLFVSEDAGWELLEKWRGIHPNYCYYRFRQTCGLIACPTYTSFQKWIANNRENINPVIDFNHKESIHLDLSVGSDELGHPTNWKNSHIFSNKIASILRGAEAEIGYGGYLENRPFYSSDAYEKMTNNGIRRRTCHLGMDIWTEAGTAVIAPLDGRVFSVFDNAGKDNYGPTIILEHAVSDDLTFYTLYGHLGMECLEKLKKGDPIIRGQQIATLGRAEVNGGWPPHLHFQVILDILDATHDFRGVCLPDHVETWSSICPDPSLFLSIRSADQRIKLSTADIHQKREKHLGQNLSVSYQKPLHIVRGYLSYLYDNQGQRFLDTVNNVAHVGHQHHRIVRAAQKQINLLNTNTRYLHPAIVEYAEDLLNTFPPELNKIYFTNSGSEANELALRMAQIYSGQRDVISVEMGYHGNTGAAVDISSYKFDRKGGKGKPAFTHVVPMPDCFRGIHAGKENAGILYAAHIKKRIEEIQSIGRNVSAFICESILSCGGQVPLPDAYLSSAYKHVRKAGGLCIADEVQVGFGRIGEAFWGFELQGVVPDIVTLGKPIGNGHPIGAVVTTTEVAEAFDNGMEYFNTYGGNPVSCRIGHEVLRIIGEEGLQKNALETGAYLMTKLSHLRAQYPIIADVRGHGLFIGFELCIPKTDHIPATLHAHYLVNRMRDRGILMSTDGPDENVIKIKPPMCFSKQQADILIENLAVVFQENVMME